MITREMINAVRDHFHRGDWVCIRMSVYGDRPKMIKGTVYRKYDNYMVIETESGYKEAITWAEMIVEGRKHGNT